MRQRFIWYRQLTRWQGYFVWGAITVTLGFLLGLWVFLPTIQDRVTSDDVESILVQLEATYRQHLESIGADELTQSADWKKQAREAVLTLLKKRDQPSAAPEIDRALKDLTQGNTRSAEAFFRAMGASEASPKNAAKALRHLGILTFLHNMPTSLDAYERAVELSPNELSGWNRLGHVLRIMGRLNRAEDVYWRLIALAQTKQDRRAISIGYGNLGLVYYRRGELGKAVTMFARRWKSTAH